MFVKLFFSFIVVCFVSVQTPSVEQIRTLYTQAASTEENAFQFYTLLLSVPDTGDVLSAYAGASQMMYARYAKNRKELLKEGKNRIENAIKKSPDNAELRFIRLSIQENLPKIVPYRQNIQEDKKFLIENIKKQPEKLQKYLVGYVQSASIFSQDEKNLFK